MKWKRKLQEKTSTTNYSDEESKNNVMFGKRDIKQIEEINKDKIIEEKAIEESKGSDNIIVLPEEKKEETKHAKKKVVKKKKKVEEQNKGEENEKHNNNTQANPNLDENQNNNDDNNNKSTDEVKTKKKKIIKKKKKEGHPIDNINKINTVETEPNKEEKIKEANEPEKEKEKEENEELKPKKKKIIKKKKKPNEENMETTETTQTIPESKTDDELGAKTKKIVKKRAKTARKTTTDVPNLVKKEERNIEEKIVEEKKIVKKKIIKKKVIKKKKKEDISVDNININTEQSKKERPETAQEKVKLELKVENSVEKSDNNGTVRSVTEAGGEPSSEKKDKYELPKIKMKRKSAKQGTKKTEDKGKEIENKNNNEEKTENKDGQTDKKEFENKEIAPKEPENKENENKEKDSKENNDKIINEEENENKKEEMEETIENMEKKEEAKEETFISDNKPEDNKKEDIESNEDNIEKKKEESEDRIEEKTEEKDIKNETDIIAEILQKTHLEEMRNYIGIVTNETIFEYLVLNYYSNEMKEFDLSLNELLVLGDIPLVKKLNNGKDMNEKVYQTFNTYLFKNNSDIIPIFNNKEIEGFIYPKDFLYYIYNCESNQSLTNEEFLINIYKDIDEEKPYGKNRVIFLELNDKNKSLYVKELIEKLNCSIEKKIVIYDPSNNNNLYLISLRTIFRAIAEFESNKK